MRLLREVADIPFYIQGDDYNDTIWVYGGDDLLISHHDMLSRRHLVIKLSAYTWCSWLIIMYPHLTFTSQASLALLAEIEDDPVMFAMCLVHLTNVLIGNKRPDSTQL